MLLLYQNFLTTESTNDLTVNQYVSIYIWMYVQVINISSSTTNSLSHRLSSHFFFSFLSGINTCRLHVSPPLAWTVHYVHYQSNLTDNQGSVSSSRCYSRCCSLCAKCQSTFTHSCIRRETYKLVHTQRLNLWYLIRSLCVCSCVWSLMSAESRRALLVWLTWLEAAVDHTAELQEKATKQGAELAKTVRM